MKKDIIGEPWRCELCAIGCQLFPIGLAYMNHSHLLLLTVLR